MNVAFIHSIQLEAEFSRFRLVKIRAIVNQSSSKAKEQNMDLSYVYSVLVLAVETQKFVVYTLLERGMHTHI